MSYNKLKYLLGEYKMYFNYTFDCPYCNYRSEYPIAPPTEFDEYQEEYDEDYQYYRPPSPPPMGPPNMGGMQGNQQSGPPMAPPPNTTPTKNQNGVKSYSGMTPMAIDSGAIRPCRNRYVFIWLTNGSSFWAWLTYVGRRSVPGWRWTGRRWVYFGTDLRRIDSFFCV